MLHWSCNLELCKRPENSHRRRYRGLVFGVAVEAIRAYWIEEVVCYRPKVFGSSPWTGNGRSRWLYTRIESLWTHSVAYFAKLVFLLIDFTSASVRPYLCLQFSDQATTTSNHHSLYHKLSRLTFYDLSSICFFILDTSLITHCLRLWRPAFIFFSVSSLGPFHSSVLLAQVPSMWQQTRPLTMW